MKASKSLLAGAALTGLLATSAFGAPATAQAGEMAGGAGQCHGVNACKGKGDCQGMGHECEGKNTCKGKGWVKMTKEECEKNPKGKWEPMPEKH